MTTRWGPRSRGAAKTGAVLRPYFMRKRSTAPGSQSRPAPGALDGVTRPASTRTGSRNSGAAQSTYSSQWQVGLAASKCELTSGKRCDESGMFRAAAM